MILIDKLTNEVHADCRLTTDNDKIKICYGKKAFTFGSLAELNERFKDAIGKRSYGGRVPEWGDLYYTIGVNGIVVQLKWMDTGLDHGAFECGNAFWSRRKANKELRRRLAYVVLKDDAKGFDSDQRTTHVGERYFVYYNYAEKCFKIGYNRWCTSEHIYFAIEDDAKESIRIHEKEWRTWLGVKDNHE